MSLEALLLAPIIMVVGGALILCAGEIVLCKFAGREQADHCEIAEKYGYLDCGNKQECKLYGEKQEERRKEKWKSPIAFIRWWNSWERDDTTPSNIYKYYRKQEEGFSRE